MGNRFDAAPELVDRVIGRFDTRVGVLDAATRVGLGACEEHRSLLEGGVPDGS